MAFISMAFSESPITQKEKRAFGPFGLDFFDCPDFDDVVFEVSLGGCKS